MAGIYIHIPFCRQKCHYCNFHFSTSLKYKNEMVEAILLEIELQRNYLAGENISTIYLGGGTPSLLDKKDLEKIIGQLHRYFSIKGGAEITLEANPDDLIKEKITAFKQVGINRLSIGVQSFQDSDLQFMNRAHNTGQSKQSIQLAQEGGFDNITMDLIYGTPTMSNEQWQQNLDTFFSFRLPHLSAYALTVEPKTALAKFIEQKTVSPVDEEKTAQQFELLMRAMKEHGYVHYEISNFCLEGKYSRHNSSYWTGEKYLGIGPSAHSFDVLSRQWNIANNANYILSLLRFGLVPFEKELLTPAQQFNEYLLTSLRTMWGCDLERITQQWGGMMTPSFRQQKEKFVQQGLLIEKGHQIFLTDQGKLLGDNIIAALFV